MAWSDQKYARALVFYFRNSNRRRRPKNDYGHQTHSEQQSISDTRLAKITIFVKFGVIVAVVKF